MKKILILSLAVLFCFSACSSSNSDDDESGQLSGSCSLKIINGDECPSGPGPVALLLGESADGTPLTMCSGSFIAKNKILTAAHCGELFLAPQVKVYTGNIEVKATSFKEHPSYNAYSLYGYQHDVGIVTLEKDVDIMPLPLLLSRQVVAGDDILVYGFGTDENGETAINHDWGNSARRTTMVVSSMESGGIVAEYDTTHSGACEGDSGGPALAESAGGDFGIAGVVSGGTTRTCREGTLEVFTELDRQVILDFIYAEVPGVGAV